MKIKSPLVYVIASGSEAISSTRDRHIRPKRTRDDMRRRIKSFTLIEILIASLIFVSVMVVATTSFALVKKSNDNSEDMKIASSCARQVEDFVKAQIKSSSFNGRVMAIDFDTTSGEYKIYPITQKMGEDVAGAVLFPAEGKYVAIFKKVTAADSSYYFDQRTGDLNINEVHTIDFLGSKIHPDTCKGMTPGSGVAGSDQPFQIMVRPRFPAATPAPSSNLTADQLSSLVFEVKLDDLLFRSLSDSVDSEAQSAREESKKVIRLNLDVENSVSSI
jgi:type II secretory pathway pseudopilin PulG